MKKTVVLLILLLTFSMSVNASVIDFTAESFDINVMNNEIYSVKTDVAPYISDNTFMIPLRATAELFGNTVLWSDETSTVFINNNIKYTLGENVFYKDEKPITLDILPLETNGRILVSKSFIIDAFSYGVSDLLPTSQVIITDEKPLMNVNGIDVPFYELSYLFNADKDKYQNDLETPVKAGVSNLFDTYILYTNAKSNNVALDDEEIDKILNEEYNSKTLKSIYVSISLKYRLSDKYSDIISKQCIPEKDEILKYAKENNIKNPDYDQISYNLGYEKFVDFWNNMYENSNEIYYMSFDEIMKMLE